MVTPMWRDTFTGGEPRQFIFTNDSPVCRRQLSFLFLDYVDCITTFITEYAVEIVNFPYGMRDVDNK